MLSNSIKIQKPITIGMILIVESCLIMQRYHDLFG